MALNIKQEIPVPVVDPHKQTSGDKELLFRLTFENAAVGIAHVGRDGHFIRINNKLSEITGYPKEELIHKTFQEITHPDDLEYDLKMAEALSNGEISSYSMEKRYFRKDGSIVWIKLTGSAVFHANGELNVFIAVIEDISEQKKLESSLQKSEEQLNLGVVSWNTSSSCRWQQMKRLSGETAVIKKKGPAPLFDRWYCLLGFGW